MGKCSQWDFRSVKVLSGGKQSTWGGPSLPRVKPGLFTGVQHDHVAPAQRGVLEKLGIKGGREVADEIRDERFTVYPQNNVSSNAYNIKHQQQMLAASNPAVRGTRAGKRPLEVILIACMV